MIIQLITPLPEHRLHEAAQPGWTRIAARRFATPEKHDVRIVRHMSELLPLPGRTPLLKGPLYNEGPPLTQNSDLPTPPFTDMKWWDVERAAFDRFVAEGHGYWLDGEPLAESQPAPPALEF